MKVGIGLPNAVRGVGRAGIVQWAQHAERAGFASLGTLDRLVYANYESLISLAAAAAVTERIELVTDILIAPLRSNTALLAKQAATIDSLSDGRLTLGLAPGGRRDDFAASGVDFTHRGRLFDRQLQEITAVWRGERGVGPAPRPGGRPGLLIGGRTDAAYQRAATYADGWTMGGGPPAGHCSPGPVTPDRPGARRLLEQSLDWTKAAHGTGHLEVAYVLSALGYVLQRQKNLDAACRDLGELLDRQAWPTRTMARRAVVE